MIMTLLYIGLGGGVGSISRYLLSVWINREFDRGFPHGLIVVNMLGCLAVGVFAAFLQRESLSTHWLSPHLKSLFIIGFLGGFTTFSGFGLDALDLFHKGELIKAAAYVTANITLSLAAVFLGFYAVEKLSMATG